MSRQEKAARLLTEGRVWIQHVGGDGSVAATVQGSRPHAVNRSRVGVWSCDCTAAGFGQWCAHREAVRQVTTHLADARATA